MNKLDKLPIDILNHISEYIDINCHNCNNKINVYSLKNINDTMSKVYNFYCSENCFLYMMVECQFY